MDIVVPSQRVPVLADSDVLVCGAGCAGIAAAVSAARHGCRVTLVERWPTVGGMATNALVNGWHRSDREKMVIYGLVEEARQRAAQHGWIRQDRQYPESVNHAPGEDYHPRAYEVAGRPRLPEGAHRP